MRDDSLCQNLHFLLRSFSSTLVKKKVDDDSVFSPIKMLTSAHCLLRNRLLDSDANGLSPGLSSPRSSRDSFEGLDSTMGSMGSSDNDNSRKTKGKRFGKLFRRGSKRGSSNEENINIEDSLETPEGVECPKSEAPNKKISFKPSSILRKSADQDRLRNDTHKKDSKVTDIPSTATLFENMGWFLSNLDQLCGQVEDALLKSFSQKLTEWALQPWSANKDRALSDGTANMRNGLNVINLLGRSRSKENNKWSPVINPVNPAECLVSIIPEESFILPSAHFPLLLTFSSCSRYGVDAALKQSSNSMTNEILYRTTVKIKAVRGSGNALNDGDKKSGFAFLVHATVAGNMKETGKRYVLQLF